VKSVPSSATSVAGVPTVPTDGNGMVASARPSVRWTVHTMVRPSGETSGSAALAFFVSRRTEPPFESTAYRSERSDTSRSSSI
jgi:hypothetical protein